GSSDRLALRGSPRNARSTLLSNELVKPLIADTTTTGLASAAAKTIFATLRKAFASSTDVPPNFIIVGFTRITQTKNSCRAYEMLSQFPTRFGKVACRRIYVTGAASFVFFFAALRLARNVRSAKSTSRQER